MAANDTLYDPQTNTMFGFAQATAGSGIAGAVYPWYNPTIAQQSADYTRMLQQLQLQNAAVSAPQPAPSIKEEKEMSFIAAKIKMMTGPAVEPVGKTIDMAEAEPIDTLDSYTALARELGISTEAVELERFKAFLSAKGLRVYDRAEVHAYLNAIYNVGPKNPGNVWGWRPLRKDKDFTGTPTYRSSTGSGALLYWNGIEPYKKPVPMPVLLTVREISKAFPAAQFFVSDEAREMPEAPKDPFLLVRLHGENFIVERWDEPGFVPKK